MLNQETFRQTGFPFNYVQDNISESKAGVIRGMHFQKNQPQGKLVSCIKGKIMDSIIDMRAGESFGKQYEVILDGDQPNSRSFFFVPPGFAHGFMAITDCIVSYKCTTLYDKASDGGINPLSCGIEWGEPEYGRICMSEKDRNLPSLVDYLKTIT